MKAAVVIEAGRPPIYGDFTQPEPRAGASVIRVSASALHHLTRGRASGAHYSTDDTLPFVPGVDGVGTTLDGTRVYFAMPEKPFGAMAQYTLVDDRHWFPIPDEIPDDAAAALANAGMSSWTALVARAGLRSGETVLVNGATGTAGRLAIQIADYLSAGKIIATGRNTAAFDELRRLGADVTISLSEDRDALERAFAREFAHGVDVILDYLWGASAEALLTAAATNTPHGIPIRFVQIGAVSAPAISLHAAALRSCGLEMLGSGAGSVPPGDLLTSIRCVLEAAPSAGFTVATRAMPLTDVSSAWAAPANGDRIVLRP